ncbi:hypothetical protein Phum_PHUM614610 [Pediculus humanus corporis]|uniref:Uncharacterized protein n=1 Tax=Pediculus humanus subsp. corporis TaxID=121224 RepID=E0W433_PEDHC|nr:uncharacterized protein Phum_PHUM614610 [Pediculus humanus corporis]EEB20389.1 hypothetical protein Phum_PHUM614610 [Pediculus humanus corporis]
MKIFIYNVTNFEDVKNGFKPILMKIGPYVYKEKNEKIFLTGKSLKENCDTLNYKIKNTIKFNNKESGNLTETDVIITVNIPHVVLSLLSGRNTESDFIEIDTGLSDYKMAGKILSVNNFNVTSNKFLENLSDGFKFTIPLNEKNLLNVLQRDACRYVPTENSFKFYHDDDNDNNNDTENDFFQIFPCHLRLLFEAGKLLENFNLERDELENSHRMDLNSFAGFFITPSFPHRNFDGINVKVKNYLKKNEVDAYYDVEPDFGLTMKKFVRIQFNLEIKENVENVKSKREFPTVMDGEKLTASNDIEKSFP